MSDLVLSGTCEKCWYSPLEVEGQLCCPVEDCPGLVEDLRCPRCNSLYVVPVYDCPHIEEVDHWEEVKD